MRILLALALLAGAAGAALWHVTREKPLEVKVVPVRRGRVEDTVTSTSSGTVRPLKQVRVLAELMGRVDRVARREGERAADDEVLLELDRKALEAQARVADANVGVARSQVDSAVMRRQKAEDDFKRVHGLYNGRPGTRYVSESEFERARMEKDLAAEAVRTAEANLRLLEAQKGLVAVDLDRSRVQAPFAGRVTRLFVEEGDSVSVGSPLFEIMDTSMIEVRAPFDEVDIGRIALGQDVRLTLDAFPDRVFPGKVVEMAPVVSTALDKNRTLDVTASVQDPDGLLRIGMSVDVVVVVRVVEDALHIPSKAIKDLRTAYVVENGAVVARTLELGVSNWDTTQVVAGVMEGEEVVSLLDLEVKGDLEGRKAVPRRDE